MDQQSAGTALVAAGARLERTGLIAATEGNLSVRLDDGRLLVTPGGRRKGTLAPAELVLVDLASGTALTAPPPGPTSDLAIHLAAYRARPDVRAIAHAHLPASMALTLAGVIPDPAALPETAAFLPRVPFVAAGELGSAELAARIAAALGEPPEPLPVVALLERHGAVAVGDVPDLAVARLELLEVLCRTWRDALLVRAARQALGNESPFG